LPSPTPLLVRSLDPPPETGDTASVEQGKALYTRFRAQCHGDAAVSGHLVADLRYSGYLAGDAWFEVVRNVALEDLGMASFAVAIDHDGAAAIRDCVIHRAHEDRALPYMVVPATPAVNLIQAGSTSRSERALRAIPSAPLRTTSSSSPCPANSRMQAVTSASLPSSSTMKASGEGSRTRPPMRIT